MTHPGLLQPVTAVAPAACLCYVDEEFRISGQSSQCIASMPVSHGTLLSTSDVVVCTYLGGNLRDGTRPPGGGGGPKNNRVREWMASGCRDFRPRHLAVTLELAEFHFNKLFDGSSRTISFHSRARTRIYAMTATKFRTSWNLSRPIFKHLPQLPSVKTWKLVASVLSTPRRQKCKVWWSSIKTRSIASRMTEVWKNEECISR